MKINIKTLLVSASVSIAFSACYYDTMEELHPAPIIIPGVNDTTSSACDTTKAISFAADVKPILDNNCGTGNSCHNGPGSNSGIDFTTYDGTKAVKDIIVGAITWDGTASNMPKNSTTKISECNIAIIKKWVNTGTAQ